MRGRVASFSSLVVFLPIAGDGFMAKKAKKVVKDARTRQSIASGDEEARTGKVVKKGVSTAQKGSRKRKYLRAVTRDARTGRFISVANEVIDDNYELLRRLAK